ncbi:MAG: hypothetical protein AAF732_19545 [Pseudomonadota bacterium]
MQKDFQSDKPSYNSHRGEKERLNEHVLALVKLLARQAAERNFEALLEKKAANDNDEKS